MEPAAEDTLEFVECAAGKPYASAEALSRRTSKMFRGVSWLMESMPWLASSASWNLLRSSGWTSCLLSKLIKASRGGRLLRSTEPRESRLEAMEETDCWEYLLEGSGSGMAKALLMGAGA